MILGLFLDLTSNSSFLFVYYNILLSLWLSWLWLNLYM
jgi:hypothetical protein